MSEIERAVLGSVRLDSDVWEAVRAMPYSLNVFLREQLLNGKALTPEIEARIAANVRPRRQTKKDKIVQALRESDVTAKELGREDIEYGPHTDLPAGPNVATLDAVGPRVSERRGKASTQVFVRGIRQKGDKNR